MQDLLLEFVDLKTAKGYEFVETPKSEWPSMPHLEWQATFTADDGIEYAFRVFRENKYGMHTRRILFMKKSSKNYTQNVTVSKGMFKKVLVTFLQCYEAFKDTPEGKKTSSYAFSFQRGLVKYLSLFMRVSQRAFRSQKKKKLVLVGVNDSGKGNTVELMFINPMSTRPYFGGKGYDEEAFTTNELYYKLSGQMPEVEEEEEEETISAVGVEDPVNVPTITQDTWSMNDVSKGPAQHYVGKFIRFDDKGYGESVALVDSVQNFGNIQIFHLRNVAAITYPEFLEDLEVSLETDDVDNELSIITKDEYDIVQSDTDFLISLDELHDSDDTHIVMNGPAKYSNVLKQDSLATITGLYYLTPSLVEDFDLPKELTGRGVLLVVPDEDPNSYVALTYEDNFKPIPSGEYKERKSEGKPAFIVDVGNPATREDAPVISIPLELTDSSSSYEYDDDFVLHFDGVTTEYVVEAITRLQDKVKELPSDEAYAMVNQVLDHIGRVDKRVSDKLHNFLMSDEDFHVSASGGIDVTAAKEYTGNSYNLTNLYLRGGELDDFQLDIATSVVEGMDYLFSIKGVHFSPNLSIYRGQSMTRAQIDYLNEGNIYTLLGYSSCSLSATVAASFIDPYRDAVEQGAVLNVVKGNNLDVFMVNSSQGNKVFLDINRLDRALSLYLEGVTTHETEKEVLLNRMTDIKLRKLDEPLTKIGISMMNSDNGLWYGRVSVVGSGDKLFESAPRSYKSFITRLNENLTTYNQTKRTLDMFTFALIDAKEYLDRDLERV